MHESVRRNDRLKAGVSWRVRGYAPRKFAEIQRILLRQGSHRKAREKEKDRDILTSYLSLVDRYLLLNFALTSPLSVILVSGLTVTYIRRIRLSFHSPFSHTRVRFISGCSPKADFYTLCLSSPYGLCSTTCR